MINIKDFKIKQNQTPGNEDTEARAAAAATVSRVLENGLNVASEAEWQSGQTGKTRLFHVAKDTVGKHSFSTLFSSRVPLSHHLAPKSCATGPIYSIYFPKTTQGAPRN